MKTLNNIERGLIHDALLLLRRDSTNATATYHKGCPPKLVSEPKEVTVMTLYDKIFPDGYYNDSTSV